MLRPFHPRRARTIDGARAVGRAWADHEADDPESLKGNPGERPFFCFFDEVSQYVDAVDMATRRELVDAVADAACERWADMAEPEKLAWETGSE